MACCGGGCNTLCCMACCGDNNNNSWSHAVGTACGPLEGSREAKPRIGKRAFSADAETRRPGHGICVKVDWVRRRAVRREGREGETNISVGTPRTWIVRAVPMLSLMEKEA